MVFAARRPTQEELERYYAAYPRYENVPAVTRSRYRELLDTFAPYRRTNRILDIGCGVGTFLDEAKQAGWDTYGTEFAARALEIIRARGITAIQAPLKLDTFEPGFFDVISAFEVFEHVPDPRAESAVIAHALRPGGLLYCTTPNFNSASRRLLRGRWSVVSYPEHLCYFTPSTLKRWLSGSGFEAVSITSTGFSLTRLRESVTRTAGHAAPGACEDDRLREAIERSNSLRLVKNAVNTTLSALGAGDTLKGRFELRSTATGS